jgi:beta-N-acetylhexosaminidase
LDDAALLDLAGQCLAVGLPRAELDERSADFLVEHRVRTVILFARNTPDPASTKRLTSDLQELASRSLDGPLLIAVDQEGGRVQRLREGATRLPSAMLLGQAGPAHVRAVARVAARELLAVGINLVLAPVLDVNVEPRNAVIGNRSFGTDPEHVADCGIAAIEAYRAEGLLSCAKHFPGHGDTAVDSHRGLPSLPFDLGRLQAVELPPFLAAIRSGLDAVMAGHLAVPQLDPSGSPATLSEPIATGLLRGRLGWLGLVCTDDLEMAGVAPSGTSAGEVAVRAMTAGCDLLFFSHTAALAREAANALLGAVRSGGLGVERLRRAAARVAACRARRPAALDLEEVGSAGHRAAVEAAVKDGVRVVRPWGEEAAVALVDVDGRLADETAPPRGPVVSAAQRRSLGTMTLDGAAASSDRGRLVVAVRRPDERTLASIRAVARRRPVTLIALAEPWCLDRIPEAGAIAACDDSEAAIVRSLDLALSGGLEAGR